MLHKFSLSHPACFFYPKHRKTALKEPHTVVRHIVNILFSQNKKSLQESFSHRPSHYLTFIHASIPAFPSVTTIALAFASTSNTPVCTT